MKDDEVNEREHGGLNQEGYNANVRKPSKIPFCGGLMKFPFFNEDFTLV